MTTDKFLVAVVQNDFGGTSSWHARCMVKGCGWSGKGRTKEAAAAGDARMHGRVHALLDQPMPVSDLLRHLCEQVNKGALRLSDAQKKCPDGWGIAFGPQGRAVVVSIPKD